MLSGCVAGCSRLPLLKRKDKHVGMALPDQVPQLRTMWDLILRTADPGV